MPDNSETEEFPQREVAHIMRRFESLEEERRYQEKQIYNNMYLSLIFIAGALAVFAQTDRGMIRISTVVTLVLAFIVLFSWSLAYLNSRNRTKDEQKEIYNQHSERAYFRHVQEDSHLKNDTNTIALAALVIVFYILLGSVTFIIGTIV